MLLQELTRLETELLRDETRRSRERMECLLHPDFVEFGRSGKRYSREEVLNEFGPQNATPAVHAENFEVSELSERAALLTYVSAHVESDGKLDRFSLRSSLWVKTVAGWQVRFHQGTPIPERESFRKP